jgi:hypothetical protein
MLPWLIGISAVESLLFFATLALAMVRKVRKACDDESWPLQDGARVLATIADVHINQDWKQGEQWERSLWDGRLTRQTTWQTCYDVTAEWTHPQTKQSYLFRSKLWSDDVAKPPTTGQRVVFIVDPRHPEHSAADVQSFSSARLLSSTKSMRAVGRQGYLQGRSWERGEHFLEPGTSSHASQSETCL